MRNIMVIFLIAMFVLSGCSSVNVYTFKKDRVDQSVSGNEGYITGEKKEAASSAGRDTQRTLIGVDIELPASKTSRKPEAEEDEEYMQQKEESKVAPVSSDTTVIQKEVETNAQGAKTVTVEQVEETEEDWIK